MADTVSVTVAVKKGGKRLGTLEVSGDGLIWKRGSRKHKVGWDAIEGIAGAKKGTAKKKRATKKRAAKKRPAKKVARKRSAARKARPAARGLARLKSNTRLQGIYKGKTVVARTTRDGRIKLGSKTYESPTAAATAVVKSGRRNGWNFWHYQVAGKWVPVSRLR